LVFSRVPRCPHYMDMNGHLPCSNGQRFVPKLPVTFYTQRRSDRGDQYPGSGRASHCPAVVPRKGSVGTAGGCFHVVGSAGWLFQTSLGVPLCGRGVSLKGVLVRPAGWSSSPTGDNIKINRNPYLRYLVWLNNNDQVHQIDRTQHSRIRGKWL